MSDELIRRILDEEIPAEEGYDSGREDSLGHMVSLGFHGALKGPLRGFIVLAWAYMIVSIVIAVWVAILFFHTSDTWYMVLYATIFLSCIVIASAVKIFVWQVLHRTLLRDAIRRDLRRLELRIVELGRHASRQSESDS